MEADVAKLAALETPENRADIALLQGLLALHERWPSFGLRLAFVWPSFQAQFQSIYSIHSIPSRPPREPHARARFGETGGLGVA